MKSKRVYKETVGRTILAALSVLTACGPNSSVESGLTGIDLTVTYQQQFDQLRFSGKLEGRPAFAPGILPARPRPLAESQESVVILLNDSLAGKNLQLTVEGLLEGEVIAEELQSVILERAKLVTMVIELKPLLEGG